MRKKADILKIAGKEKDPEKKGKKLIEKAYKLAEKTIESKGAEGKKQLEQAERIAENLFELGFDNTTIAAGLVCGMYSEEEISDKEILEILGKEVESIAVDYGKIRKIEEKNFGKIDNKILSTIVLATARDLRSIFIKFATRLDVMQNETFGKKELGKKAEGALDIYAPICQKMGLYDLESMLEDNSLKILEPDTYNMISSLLGKTRKTRNKEVEIAIAEFSSYIREKPTISIEGRAKSIYSIYKKMEEQGKAFEEIYDLVGIRIICDSVRECYEILGIVHSEYKTIPNQFTDYIANPKKNGYRSIHTAVEWKRKHLEVQIRTWEMHYECETGLAAHWNYKKYAKDKFFDKRLSLIKQLVDWHRTARNSESITHSLKMGFGQNKIFVFTPKQEVVVLLEGGSPLDFAFAIHSDLGIKCLRAKVNGKIVQLSHKLENGDLVEIITAKHSMIKRLWLSIAKSHKAQIKIRQKLGLKPGKKSLIKNKNENLTSDANTKIAKCCNPVPGDEIIGIRTTKRKISVHRASCRNVARVVKGKKIKISWDLAKKDYVVEIKVRARDSPGTLPTILKILEKSDVTITATDAKTSSNNVLQCKFNIKIKNLEQLDYIIEKIDNNPTVFNVERE